MRSFQGIRFPCAESLPRLVQPPLSPLPCQAEPFHAVQAPAEQRLLHFRLRLPISRTRGHGSRISCVTPVGSQHEAAFQRILLDWPLGLKTSFFPKPNFETHVGVSLEGSSRSEPIKIHVWSTVPAAALIPLFLPPAPSFAAPGVGGTLIRASALRHFGLAPSHPGPCIACDPLQLSVPSSAPVVASGCTRLGRGKGGGGGDALLAWQQSHVGQSLPPGIYFVITTWYG